MCCLYVLHNLQGQLEGSHALTSALNIIEEGESLMILGIAFHTIGPKCLGVSKPQFVDLGLAVL